MSPRLIKIPLASNQILVQDLVDTLRELEEEPVNMAYTDIVRASGKQFLTNDLLVGITCTLLDAKVLFEDLGGPTQRRDVKGGNLLALDDMGVAMSPIEESDFTQVVHDLSPSPTLVTGVPAGGTRAFGIIQG